ncbi:MAG: glycosyltransferase family 2 protein [Pseudomonadota bacterium]
MPTVPANRDAELPALIDPGQKRWQHIWLAPLPRPQATATAYAPSKPRAPGHIDLERDPPDPRLIDRLGADVCLRHGLVPWRRVGGATVVACADAATFAAQVDRMTATLGPVLMARAPQAAVERAVLNLRGPALVARAETALAADASCRSLATRPLAIAAATLAIALTAAAILVPTATFSGIFGWAMLALLAMTVLRTAALVNEAHQRLTRARAFSTARNGTTEGPLPRISILVPLLWESSITDALIARLSALDYPAERREFLFVLEQSDGGTHHALAGQRLGPGMRIVTVPPGTVRTKPRALNYALDFARGDIIGIYDAEDAPDRDQLRRVAEAFAHAAPDVACLQGRLDFDNARQNWLTRAFTLDYAAWFRVFLPGLARLGFAIPLGGTTLFLRRAALEQIGRWDAHNVTEDADLGIRLARHGYRTELIDTTTQEEAASRLGPWIRQRSRWLKGYALTYGVHMRRPGRLLAQLGLRRFLGFQIMFLGTLTLFICTPLFWTFWLLPFGLPHPAFATLPDSVRIGTIALFLTCEAVTLLSYALALSGTRHRRLWVWIPTMHVYFALAVMAAYRGLSQIFLRPFFWEKTAHGLVPAGPATPRPASPRRPAATASQTRG